MSNIDEVDDDYVEITDRSLYTDDKEYLPLEEEISKLNIIESRTESTNILSSMLEAFGIKVPNISSPGILMSGLIDASEIRGNKHFKGVDKRLVDVMRRAYELNPNFSITCGLRTPEEQAKIVKAGKSTTNNSRHLTGHAVDILALVNGKGTYTPRDLYTNLAYSVAQAATELDVPI